jgi:hypothetical protein
VVERISAQGAAAALITGVGVVAQVAPTPRLLYKATGTQNLKKPRALPVKAAFVAMLQLNLRHLLLPSHTMSTKRAATAPIEPKCAPRGYYCKTKIIGIPVLEILFYRDFLLLRIGLVEIWWILEIFSFF